MDSPKGRMHCRRSKAGLAKAEACFNKYYEAKMALKDATAEQDRQQLQREMDHQYQLYVDIYTSTIEDIVMKRQYQKAWPVS